MPKKKINKYVEDIDTLNRRNKQREITFNGMSATEWTLNSRSVWKDLPNIKSYKGKEEIEVLPDELLDRIISIYSKEDDKVLDPFMGSGSTIISGIKNNRYCIGYEIESDIYRWAEDNILNSLNLLANGGYDIKNISCFDGVSHLKDNSIQLTLTSPSTPYLKKKVVETGNFSSLPINSYLSELEALMKDIYRVTKKNGYCVFVVSDYRNIKGNEPYFEFHHEIASIGKKVGFLYQDLIIYDHNDQRGLLLLGYPNIFYANLNHSYIVVLRKA